MTDPAAPRGGRLRIALFVVAAAAAAVGLIVPLDVQRDREFWLSLFNAGHYPLFAVLTALIFQLPSVRARGAGNAAALAAGAASATAASAEVVQPYFGRTASTNDLLNGLVGIAVGATGAWLWSTRGRFGWRALHLVAASAVLVALLQPSWTEFRAIRWRASHFPLLADFESPVERTLWRSLTSRRAAPTSVAIVAEHAASGAHALRVETRGGAWPGVRYAAGYTDWSGYGAFVLDVFNPDEPFALNVRVDDDGDCSRYGARFNRRLTLESGWNRVELPTAALARGPRERLLNLRRIAWVYLFTGKLDAPRTFLLDRVRLEGAPAP